jgi:hypothetical protein
MSRESWELAFEQRDGTRGRVRLAVFDDRAAYWAFAEWTNGEVVVVRDDDVALPRGPLLEVRADGLWAEVVCEVPAVHWGFGLEAFGLAFASVDEARIAERGDRLPVGLDLEWDGGEVVGELLVGRERVPFEGRGTFEHAREGADPEWRDWLA